MQKYYTKNHLSLLGIRDMLEIIFILPLYLLNKLKYKNQYQRYKEVKSTMSNIQRLQKQYIQKTTNYATGQKQLDYSTVPQIWYKWDNNEIALKLKFNHKITEKDVTRFMEEIKFATQLIPIDNHAKDLCIYFSLVSNAGKPREFFITKKNAIPFGTKFGKVIEWLFDKYPHALIAGETGTGKSSLIYYFLSSILSNYTTWCIDGKDVDYWALRDNFSYYAGISSTNECFDLLQRFQSQMQERYNDMKKDTFVKYTQLDLAPVFLIIDEFPSVVEAMDTAKLQKAKYSQRDEFLRIVGDIVRRGRAAGFFLVICMQRADARYIGGDTRDNMRLKIGLGSMTEDAYSMLFGNEHRKLEELGMGQGYYKLGNELSMFAFPELEKVLLDKQLE